MLRQQVSLRVGATTVDHVGVEPQEAPQTQVEDVKPMRLKGRINEKINGISSLHNIIEKDACISDYPPIFDPKLLQRFS